MDVCELPRLPGPAVVVDSTTLPMPFIPKPGGPKFTIHEWREYRDRRGRHLALYPQYDARWHRPHEGTAASVWAILRPPDAMVDKLRPSAQIWSKLTDEER